MTKVKNLRVPRKYKILKEIFIFFLNALALIALYMIADMIALYKVSKLRSFLIYLFAVGVFVGICIVTFAPIYKEVYKISFIGDQVMFYTSKFVYAIRRKECKEIYITNQVYQFHINGSIKLKCNIRRNNKASKKGAKNYYVLDEFNKKNFPTTKIIDKRN